MRIISLYQPYATLLVLGIKKWETRCWYPKSKDIFGTLGIHATAVTPKWAREDRQLNRICAQHDLVIKNLPRGVILGTCDLVSTMTTEAWCRKFDTDNFLKPTPDEWWLGDYSPKRYAWEMANPVLFNFPIKAKGSQGFWFHDTAKVNITTGQLQLF